MPRIDRAAADKAGKDAEALALYLEGLTLREIAAAMRLPDMEAAYRAVAEGMSWAGPAGPLGRMNAWLATLRRMEQDRREIFGEAGRAACGPPADD